MIEFFKRLFAPEQSGATAKERLRLVLLSDHLSLAPDVVESLRADLISVISKYVEVDEANCDVSFEQQDRAVAVLANIPILAMRERSPGGGPVPPPAPGPPSSSPRPPSSSPPPRSDPPPREDAFGAAYCVAEPEGEVYAVAAPAPSRAAPSGPAPRKRRRRRRAANSTATAT